MKIFQKNVGNVCVLELEGKITIGEGDVMMRDAILGLLKMGQKNILINMARVSYMDSSGVGELLSCLTQVTEGGGKFKLLNISTKIQNLLHIAQILSVFEYFNDEETAVASFQ
ncbi:MAG: STAS domain-containing protein [Acidobacteriota bacterium]|nr:STAS domain-containing protein [Acidobacteriota bacterium]